MMEKLPGYNKLVLPVHFWQAWRAGRKYGWPAKRLRVIGVTGTNGKTTTCFMIWKMLNEAGYKAGLLTTVGWGGVGRDLFSKRPTVLKSATAQSQDVKSSSFRCSTSPCSSSSITSPRELSDKSLDATVLHQQVEHMTTERVEVLNERMRAVAEAGAEFLVLEVTSHALVQFRTLGVPIEIAVFTNLTHEHLDYHGTFENYRKAKMKLFEKAKYGMVNADDASADWFSGKIADSSHSERLNGSGDISNAYGDIITYGIEHGEVRATDIKLSASGVEYACGEMKIKTRIPGEFNVYNSLAAVCVGKKLGLTDKQIEDGIYALESVEGRMNRIDEGQDFMVIVDYAHTPDALEKVLSSVITSSDSPVRSHRTVSTAPLRASNLPRTNSKQSTFSDESRKVITVHGGAGRRDESTRKIRGEILGKYSDIVIVTEDDSRDEDPAKIAEQFVLGAEKFGKVQGRDLFVELDRRKAIEKAIGLAKAGDIVLVLGKGHEKTILRAEGACEFEDAKVVREILRK